MNPAFPLSWMLPVAIPAIVVLGICSWRATRLLPLGQRLLLCSLRVASATALVALLINPGRWMQPVDRQTPPWLVLVDGSGSMNQPLAGGTRHQAALELARMTSDYAREHGIPLEIRSFDSQVSAPLEPDAIPAATGAATDLSTSLNQLLSATAAAGAGYSGVLALSDGRQTHTPDAAELGSLVLRLRAHETRFHAVAIGSGQPLNDLAVIATRPVVTGFRDQMLRIPFALKSSGLKPIKPLVQLLDMDGRELASTRPEVRDGQTVVGAFEIPCPAKSTRLELATATQEHESIASNNRDAVRIRVLESKTRIFLAEGAPYWDSKFLAQLLRQQNHIDLQSTHRISGERYFHINSGEQAEHDGERAIFPRSLEELSRFDLIIFGKNADSFLDPATTSALRTYVRDRGGAVLFSRGKPTTGQHPGLEPLEPVSWGAGQLQDFRFLPTPDGEAASLFGEALPARTGSVWAMLPTLKDARAITAVKPFSRILATASRDDDDSLARSTPALIMRRYGQGVTGLVNGDGLWKWDFYPEARELGNMYEDFWVQLIQWMASYSEFLPGHDYSLQLSPRRCLPGVPVTATLSYRGLADPVDPKLVIQSPDGTFTTIEPARQQDSTGQPQWQATIEPDSPGGWVVQLQDPRPDPGPEILSIIDVSHPPSEGDDLSSDPTLLAALCKATGSGLHDAGSHAGFLNHHFTASPAASSRATAIWRPSWLKWPLALLLILPLACEWFLRRRQGLA